MIKNVLFRWDSQHSFSRNWVVGSFWATGLEFLFFKSSTVQVQNNSILRATHESSTFVMCQMLLHIGRVKNQSTSKLFNTSLYHSFNSTNRFEWKTIISRLESWMGHWSCHLLNRKKAKILFRSVWVCLKSKHNLQ